MESLEEWMENLQGQLRSLVGQVRAVLDTDEVVAFGPFLYVYVAKVSPSSFDKYRTEKLSLTCCWTGCAEF